MVSSHRKVALGLMHLFLLQIHSAAGKVNEGMGYGRLAFELCERFEAQSYEGIHPWSAPLQEAIQPLHRAYRSGLATGFIESAMICACHSLTIEFETTALPGLEERVHELVNGMIYHGQESIALYTDPLCGS